MLKNLLNKKVNGTSVYALTEMYIMLALAISIVAMLGMAAAGISMKQEHAGMAIFATMGVLVSIGIAFLTLDCLSDRVRLREMAKKPFGYSWAQWGLMFSGLAVALVVGPYLYVDEDDKKNGMARMAGMGGIK